ncbi:MAG: ECF transporter S component [Eubacteriales bacterium]|nr:ECF transporter S component [Eubacteriales bacterium]
MTKRSTVNPKVIELTMTAFLATLIILMTFTPIGYIPVGPLKLTLLTLPVAVGSVVLGWKSGLILGGVFGISSFITCFGMDAFGVALMAVNPFLTAVVCIVPRLLCGLLPALLFKLISKDGTCRLWVAIPICGGAVAVTNTVLFLFTMWLCFSSTLLELVGTNNLLTIFGLFAGTNGLIEIAVNVVVGTAICKPLFDLKKRLV